jgi:hypothetical protein
MRRNNVNAFSYSLPLIFSVILAAMCGFPAAGQQASTKSKVLNNAVVNPPLKFDVSPPLGEMLTLVAVPGSSHATHAPLHPKQRQPNGLQANQTAVAPAAGLAPSASPLIGATVGLSFEGVGDAPSASLNCANVTGFAVAPPDTNAAVGDTQVVEWVNICYAVFDKSSGAVLAGPVSGNAFWAGFGGPCETSNDGDIIIQWDKKNHRWLASQNVFSSPYMTCIAVSQTNDATGSYYRYAFPQPGFPDYPKWGLTPNVYYQTQNDFGPQANAYVGVNVCAYQGNLMRKGNSHAAQICVLDTSNGTLFDDSMLPADDDSSVSVSGAPEVLLGSIDNFLPGDSHVYEYVFTPDFDNPANSSLAGVDGSMPINVPAFDLAFCVSGKFLTTDCVPQPQTNATLDTLGDRLMYRLAHSVTDQQHFMVTHNVNDTTAVAARWYEFRAPADGSTNLSLYQSGQTPDDSEYRWMGSIARDKLGNIALGYSRSSGAHDDYPSIYYSGQTAGDPPGTTEREALIKQGSGSQRDTVNRWGDYSSMALDGADSCTFWYANEYYPATGSFAWATWLASLKFPSCH